MTEKMRIRFCTECGKQYGSADCITQCWKCNDRRNVAKLPEESPPQPAHVRLSAETLGEEDRKRLDSERDDLLREAKSMIAEFCPQRLRRQGWLQRYHAILGSADKGGES